MKNLNISTRILIGFSTLLILIVFLGVFAFMQFGTLNTKTKELTNIWMPSTNNILQMNIHAANFRLWEYRHVVVETKEDKENSERRMDEKLKLFEENKNIYIKIISTKDEQDIYNEFKLEWGKYLEIHDEIIDLSRKNLSDSVKAVLFGKSKKYYDLSMASLQKLVEININGGLKATKESEQTYSSSVILIILVILICIITGILLSIYISNSISKGINKIQSAAQKIAKGEMNVDLDISSKDEIAKLADAFKLVIQNINTIIDTIQTYINLTKSGRIEEINFNEKEYHGAYREIISSINSAAQTTVKPISETLAISQKLAVGDLSQKMNSVGYEGCWLQLSNSINQVIDANLLVVDNAKKIANGDLTITLYSRSTNDELMISLSDMVDKLKSIVTAVAEATENVAAGSAQLSSAATQIAQGANEQAASSEQVSSSIEEMSTTIQQNSENALQTEKIAKEGADGILNVAKASEKSIEAIRTITEKIVIINEIAEKTDILAINAAIEAARAGEHGKGFAVVAAEVRKLAEVSQKAAKEINELSKLNLKFTEDAGVLMKEIIPNIQKTSQLVQEIAAASAEQNSGASQIAKAIEQFSEVTQQNSASAEQMSTGSEELASQAEMLKDVVSYFKIDQQIHIKKLLSKQKQNVLSTKPSKKGVSIKLHEEDKIDNEFEKI